MGLENILNKTKARVSEIGDSTTTEIILPQHISASDLPICSDNLLASSSTTTAAPHESTSSNQYASFTINQISLPISQTVTDIEVRNNTVYASTDSSVTSDSDIYIFDITSRSAPQTVSSLNTGPGTSGISIVGRNLFAAAASTAYQLHIIDISNRSAPVILTRYKIPPPYATATMPLATAIAYSDIGSTTGKSYILIGTEKWDGNELNVIDVTDLLNPVWVSSIELGSKVNSIHVYRDIAYVTSAGPNQLVKINISDPFHPYITNTFSPSGWSRQEGKTVNIYDDHLAFGRTSGGYDIATDHEYFIWPNDIPSTTNASSTNISSGVYGIIQDASHAFVLTRQPGRELMVFSSKTANIIASSSIPLTPRSMTCDFNRFYISALNAPIIYELY